MSGESRIVLSVLKHVYVVVFIIIVFGGVNWAVFIHYLGCGI
jgi:hypothetical protein